MAKVNLAQLRKNRRQSNKAYTQQECADVLGVSLPTYRKYEADPSKMRGEDIKKLSEYLGVSPDIFLK